MHRVEKTLVPVAPHLPEILAHVVHLHMKIGGEAAEVTRFIKEIKARTHVVLKLGWGSSKDIIRRSLRKGAGGTRTLKASAA